jgi:hypothetical protein
VAHQGRADALALRRAVDGKRPKQQRRSGGACHHVPQADGAQQGAILVDSAEGEAFRGTASLAQAFGCLAAARLAEGEEPMNNTMRDYAEAEVLEGDKLRPMAKKNIAAERQKISELADQYKRETRGKKAGGTVRSASGRADGIAQRGKTKGKYL